MYDPTRPESIFEPGALAQFSDGLTNAYRLRHGIDGGNPFREDVGRSMTALGDAEGVLRGDQE